MVDFDSLQSDTPAQGSTAPVSGGLPSFDSLQDDNDTYGTGGQQGKAFLEGAGRGVAGPLAPEFEKRVLGVKEEDIRGREAANPITSGLGEAAGFTGSLATGIGEGAIAGHLGQLAAEAAGVGEAVKSASLGYRVGSSGIKQAAEMAVLQSGDEAAKQVVNDPDASAQSAIANIGLASALGAGFGGLGGAGGKLWEATAGPKVDEFLTGLRSHLNGTSEIALPDAVAKAEAEIGAPLPPALKAAMTGNPKAMQLFNELREAQHPEIVKALTDLHENNQSAILNSLGLPVDELAESSSNEAGHQAQDTFIKEYNDKYEPEAQAQETKKENASAISVPDESRYNTYGRIIESGIKGPGTDSPAYELYNKWGNRVLAKDTIGGLDKLQSEIGNDMRMAYRNADGNTANALKEIKQHISDLQEAEITKQSPFIGKEGVSGGEDLLSQRAAANASYAKFAKMSNDLGSHIGIGDFKGAGNLKSRITEKLSPEELLKKFSPKNNMDIVPFLNEHFPDTLAVIRRNEAKSIIAPAIENGNVNPGKLSKIIQKGMKDKADYMRWALPEQLINKTEAANTLNNALPNFKSSGTAGWISKLTKHVPASTIGAVGWLTGHGPIASFVAGELTQRLGKDAPEAVKLATLNWLAADKPVKAAGFKASVDFIHAATKGDTLINKSVDSVVNGGKILTLPNFKMPDAISRAKLDKMVADRRDIPDQQVQAASDSHLGHYMPQHQVSASQTTTLALQHLQQLKPQPTQLSPLDKPIKPTAAQEARYNRALDIAQQPAIIMQHIKDGTLQATDIQDLSTMYPALYQSMVKKLTTAVSGKQANEEGIPYHTRVGISLFMGQPLDTSMQPASIQAAQPKPPQQPPPTTKSGNAKGSGKSANALNKISESAKTPGQAAESDRAGRE